MGPQGSGLRNTGLQDSESRAGERPTQAEARLITPEERARAVVLRYRTADPDTRPSLTAMIAEAIREAEQARQPVGA